MPARHTLVLLVAPILALMAVGLVASALTPVLLKEHPLLLIALEARNRNLLMTANQVELVPFVAVGLVRRVLTDPLYFLLGYHYGDRALRWAERRLGGGRLLVGLTEQGWRRASAAMVFFFPGALVCVLAGVTRMKGRVFIALNVVGTLAAILVIRLFARILAGPIDALLRFNDRNFKWLTAASVVIVVAWVAFERLRGSGEIETLEEIEEELESGGQSS